MSDWDWKALADRFRAIEQEAADDLLEVQTELKNDPSREALFDERLVRFFVWGGLETQGGF